MDIVLVHGSYHGGWCFEPLVPALERLGHRAITVDLPISDRAADLDAYADAVAAVIPPGSDPVIVGHSMGGLVVPLVPSRRPVARLIFLAAFLPVIGWSANDLRTAEPIDPRTPPSTSEWTDLGDGLWAVGAATATEIFFGDASPDLAAWAIERLRPQSYKVFAEVTPLTEWPDVPCRSIVCRDDRAIDPDWVRRAAVERLSTTAVEIDGAHSPFMTRPAELAAIIDQLARD